MAKYSKTASKKVAAVMHEMKEGKLKTGSGKKVTSPKQAIAIALSEAREAGAKVPEKATAKTTAKKTAGAKAGAKKTATKKAATSKAVSKKTATSKKAAAKTR
jgi:hypothetical protein